MQTEQLEVLATLPLLLNSSLDLKRVIGIALKHIKLALNADAATVFLIDQNTQELVFWAPQGEQSDKLENRRLPSSRGIVGWVINNQQAQLINDPTKDERFFNQVDRESGFSTRNLICVPLTAAGKRPIGALQVLNKKQGNFKHEDLEFSERFSHQLTLSLENARLYESLEERTLKLTAIERKKNEMISIISHEFRTPCGLIQTSVDLLSSGSVSPETAHEVYEILIKGADRLSQLVEQIKNISLVSESKLRLTKSGFQLTTIFEKLEQLFEPVFLERNLTFTHQLEDQAENVVGDPNLILVVLQNLISNAIRFTPDEGKISLTAKRDFGAVRIAVSDTGIGIDKSQHQLIQEKFYEIRDINHHKSGRFKFNSCGLGLGLATAKSILQAHGSGLALESALGQGSTFSFTLPAE